MTKGSTPVEVRHAELGMPCPTAGVDCSRTDHHRPKRCRRGLADVGTSPLIYLGTRVAGPPPRPFYRTTVARGLTR